MSVSAGKIAAEVEILTGTATKQLAQLQTAVNNVSTKTIPQLANEAKQAGMALTTMGNSGGNARQSLIGLTQVIQDAPYGIRGVANNIQFLTQSFGSLVTQTGGVGLALKSMGGMLTGPLGILFAVSIVTAGLDFLSNSFRKTGDEAEKSSEGLEEFLSKLKAMSSYEKTVFGTELIGMLRTITQEIEAQEDAVQSLISPMGMMQRMFSTMTQVGTLSEENNLLVAIKETLKEHPELLKQFQEQLDKIIEQEKLREVFGLIEKKYLAEHGSELEKNKARQKEINKELESGHSSVNGHILSEKELLALSDERLKLQSRIKEITQTTEDKKKEETKKEKEHLESIKQSASEILLYYKGASDVILEQLGNLWLTTKTEEERAHLLKIINDELKKGKEVVEVTGDAWGKINEAGISADKKRRRFVLDGMEEEQRARENLNDSLKVLIEEGVITEQEAEQRKAEFHKMQVESKLMTEQDAVTQSMSLLAQAFPQMKGLAVAEAIINTYLAATKALASAPPPFNIILAATTIASGLAQVEKITSTEPGFAGGGYTGDGERFERAGSVHRGEVVFENPIVQRNKSELLGLRSALQQGARVSDIVGGNSMVIAQAIDVLRKDVRSMQIQQPIILQGTMDGQRFLRRNMKKYQQFEKAKIV